MRKILSAEDYQELRLHSGRARLAPMFIKYLKQVHPDPDMTVLDVGCGPLYEEFRREFGDKYRGTDIDPHVRCDEVMSAEDIHYENQFDVTSGFSVIEHVDNPMIALKQMFKACKKGVLLTTDLEEVDMNGDPTHLYCWTPKVFRQFLSKVGFNQNVWSDMNVMFGVTYKK